MENFLISGLTTLGLMLGYTIVKRIRNSKCVVDTCGIKIDSIPEKIELQRVETEKLRNIVDELRETFNSSQDRLTDSDQVSQVCLGVRDLVTRQEPRTNCVSDNSRV